MTKNNEYHQFSDNELSVLAFLKNLKQYAPENFDYLSYFGVSAREMINFIEHPEKYGDFDFMFVCSLFEAINKTFKNYIIECPEIPAQKKEDEIMRSILMNSNSGFRSLFINEKLINKSHLNAYLLREDEIYKWNGWLLSNVKRKVEQMRVEMKLQIEITG